MTTIAVPSNLEREVLSMIVPASSKYEETEPQCPTRQSALMLLSRCAQSIEDPSTLMDEAAILAATTLDAKIVLATDLTGTPGQLLRRISKCSSPGIRHESLYREITDDSPTGSIAGFALHTGHPIVVADLARETRFTDGPLVESGAASGIVCPAFYQEKKFGA
ncbi:MAG: GAF domain-containing protein, partial [Myxococcales bacterium]|nr:GAF domain-containing protein [Myxococcales bacterium]